VTGAPALSLRGISKRYGDLVANDAVDLDVRSGEVLALLGENGAGKSTLMKIAYGFERADSGTILRDGVAVRFGSPLDARRLGLGMLFQQFTLIPAFTVAENLALFLPGLPALVDAVAVARRVRDVAVQYGLAVDPARRAGELSAGEQQRVEVVKLLLAGSRVLIFDEPTSVLVPQEIATLFAVFERLRADGHAIVFITHKLGEALSCAQRIAVMRAGRLTGTLDTSDATEDKLVALMFASAAPHRAARRRAAIGPATAPPVLELHAARTHATGRAVALRDVVLDVRAGEIVGVAGIAGNGQRELGDLVLGTIPCVGGTKRLFGVDATHWSVERVRDAGVAFIPENPLAFALAPRLSLEENMALGDLDRYTLRGGLGLDWGRVRTDLVRALEHIGVRDAPLRRPVVTLSGGNVQRFIFARELAREPRLLVALYPTKGLDVRTAAAAQEQLLSAREGGAGVLLISQDLSELLALSDRLVVLREGRVVGALAPERTTPYDVGRLMSGVAA
jgi:ABC-type uncharacterized transport system ATPase subunit